MQEGCYDYYNNLNGRTGACCLECPDKEEGCLCFDCACTKCYFYNSGAKTVGGVR